LIDIVPRRDRLAEHEGRRVPARDGGTDPPKTIGHGALQGRHEVLAGTNEPAKETRWIT